MELTRDMRKMFFETNLTLQFSNIKTSITNDSIVLAICHCLNLLNHSCITILRTLNKLLTDDCILLAPIVEKYGELYNSCTLYYLKEILSLSFSKEKRFF